MKLHLGCGTKIINSFINIDTRMNDGVDLVSDIRDLSNYKNDTISLIYCSHVLEHLSRHEYKNSLKRWFDLLKPDGILRLAVPDFESIVSHYNNHKNLEILRGLLWGGQTYKENYHFCGWDFDTLKKDLLEVGFKDIYRYDWRDTEHSHIDDFSQCYLPHMDKQNGQLMSLNVEAIK